MIELIDFGVLDRPVKPGDDIGYDDERRAPLQGRVKPYPTLTMPLQNCSSPPVSIA